VWEVRCGLDKAREAINALVDKPKTIRQGKIKSVSTAKYDCEIEDGEETIKNVPLQVMRVSDGTGIIGVPKVGTQCLYGYLMDGRVTFLQAQDYDKIIQVTANKNGIQIDSNFVKLGNIDSATHFVAYGTDIQDYLLNWVYPVIVAFVPATPPPTGLISDTVQVS
jgi:hypothetical protein